MQKIVADRVALPHHNLALIPSIYMKQAKLFLRSMEKDKEASLSIAKLELFELAKINLK